MLSRHTQQPSLLLHPRGQAALIATIVLFSVGTVIISTLTTVAIAKVKTVTQLETSMQSYYTAESGIEDSLLRIMNSDYTYTGNDTITIGDSSATVAVDVSGNQVNISSVGTDAALVRKLAVQLRSNIYGASFNYGVQIGDGGLTMQDNSVVYGNVYSNGNVVGINHATVTGDVIVATGSPSSTDSAYTVVNAYRSIATASSNKTAAQSFTPATTGALTKVAVYIAKVGSPNDNLQVRINTDNNNKPSSTSIAQESIPASSVGTTASWIEIGVSNPPMVTAGTRYWIVLDVNTSSSSKYWKWGEDTTDSYPGQTAKYASGCCSGSIAWSSLNADLAFETWVGGTPTRIEGMTVGDATTGTGRANYFVDTTIHGAACPNAYCIADSPTPSDMPLSDGAITDMKSDAYRGGTCTIDDGCDADGNLILDGHNVTATLGPKEIIGDLIVRNYGELTLTGTIWVNGNIDLNNHCSVVLNSTFGVYGGILGTDGTAAVSNHCDFIGTGQTGGYPMLISTYSGAEPAIDLNNQSTGVIFYAGKGNIDVGNNAEAKS